jgi:pimeloyl-ACP methyl ester carboxylesterase/DNA-binding winged helix-turn-helix (wHTH) protein
MEASGSYQFGPFTLDIRERRLTRDATELPLRLKVFHTLRVLVEHHGRLLTKEELLAAVWPDTVVEENNLNHNISVLRKALGEKATGQRYIETVPRVGYRFAADVVRLDDRSGVQAGGRQAMPAYAALPAGAAAVAVPVPTPRQEIRYCVSGDGVHLAYATAGTGPPLVKASNWLTHLDFEWGSPLWRHWWAELSRHHRVVRYDERGNGMSQRDVGQVSFDTWVRDLETVVDAAGLDRFDLLGISRGGAIAIAYAVRYPERVNRLVLYGAFPVGLSVSGTPDQIEARRALVSLMRLGWGLNNPVFRKLFTSRFIPDATPEHEDWFDELQRVSTSPENAARLMELDDAIDVRALAPQLVVPTLVMHCDRDQAVSARHGRWLAASIPGARFVSLPGANHLPLETEPAWPMLLDELGLFLGWNSGTGARHC